MKLVIGIILCVQFAFGVNFTYPDFKQCFVKNKKSFVYFGDLRAVAVGKYLAVAYSKTTPKTPFIKHDPFLNLYLFKSSTPLHPVKLKSTSALKVGEWIAGMDEQSLFAGNFAKSADVLDSMYLQNAKIDENSIVSCLCCDVYGLGTGEGEFIGSEYIKRFINSKNIYYGDIGARFTQKGEKFYVASVDPFSQNKSLKVGDEVLKVDANRVYSLKALKQKILFAKPNSKITLEIKRANKILKTTQLVSNRMSGGSIAESFLEKKGIFLSADLTIKKILKDSFAQMHGLKIGDKILEVDRMKMTSLAVLRKTLSETKNSEVSILFDRNDFQFFVNLSLEKK